MGPGLGAVARVYLCTLGCPKNEADSRGLSRRLSAAGAVLVNDPADCTHIVVNTCGFIQEAKEESLEVILDACAQYPGKKVVVVGCLVERHGDELREAIPEVAAWSGLVDCESGTGLGEALLGARVQLPVDARTEELRGGAHAYLKISDGCDESCTFCAIPGFKGPYRSVGLVDILTEAQACLAEGARELTLVGQDTSCWTSDGIDLAGLVDLIAEDERVRWIRLMYLQPARVDGKLLGFMASHSKLCRYLDVPFQHSHPEVLMRMGRSGDGETYLKLLDWARRLMPDVSVRSTFIVGFPGETETQFEHLLDFVARARFDYAGGFVYSPEEDTAAKALRPVVSRRVAERRLKELNDVLMDAGEQVRRRLVGTESDVMVESVEGWTASDGPTVVARIPGQAPDVDGVTYLEGRVPESLTPGDVVRARIVAVAGSDLFGEVSAA